MKVIWLLQAQEHFIYRARRERSAVRGRPPPRDCAAVAARGLARDVREHG